MRRNLNRKVAIGQMAKRRHECGIGPEARIFAKQQCISKNWQASPKKSRY